MTRGQTKRTRERGNGSGRVSVAETGGGGDNPQVDDEVELHVLGCRLAY